MPQRVDKLSDEQLMDRLAGSEVETALSALYDRYSRTVFGVGLKILGDYSLAEELVQEAFLKVWRSSHTFDPSRGSFSTWLYRLTRNVALDLYRSRARRVNLVPHGDPYIAAIRDSSPGPQETVDDSWLSWRVSRALEGLGAAQREVIELAYFQGLSRREIARQTGVPLSTVKTRTSSALQRLRKGLTGQVALCESSCDETCSWERALGRERRADQTLTEVERILSAASGNTKDQRSHQCQPPSTNPAEEAVS